MRNPAFLLACLCSLAAGLAQAQVVYPQQNVYEQRRQGPATPPCYDALWQKGMDARRQGDHKSALEAFRKAGACADFPDDTQLRDDLASLIAQSERALERARQPTANGEIPRRRHVYSTRYLRDTTRNCYDITFREAERAFADSCWDDAANLFRAAKSCADANQTLRMALDRRILTCRLAAEDELRASEQKAVRRERHAVASNLAAQARSMLKASDRTLAYRLADFANEYVAPALEDNADCLQTMYDAWYYSPEEHGKLLGKFNAQVPFCYQLKDNLGPFCQIRIAGQEKNTRLFVFSPIEHRLYQWKLPAFAPSPDEVIAEEMKNFDASPDARTLLFFSDTEYRLWRGKEDRHTINVPKTGAYCFSADGRLFYYWDAQTLEVREVDLLSFSGARKGGPRKPSERVVLTLDDDQVAGLQQYEQDLWVAYADRYEVWNLDQQQRSRTIRLLLPPPLAYKKRLLFPQLPGVMVELDTATLFCEMPRNRDTLYGNHFLSGTPMAYLPEASLTAHFIELSEETGGSSLRESFGFAESRSDQLVIRSALDGTPAYTAFLQPGDIFTLQTGAFSPDGKFFAAVNDEGRLKLWVLDDAAAQMAHPLTRSDGGVINTNGANFGLLQNRQLALAALDDPGQTEFIPLPGAGELNLLSLQGKWLLYAIGDDTLAAFDLSARQVQMFPARNIALEKAALADTATQTLIYADGRQAVYVRNLVGGGLQHTLPGYFSALAPAPNGHYLVVQQLLSESSQEEQTLARLWDPSVTVEKLPVVRLHGFAIHKICVSASSALAAFSDGYEVRIFSLDNLLDERVRLRAYRDRQIRDMAFTADETALAVHYDDGSVVFWELSTAQWRFHLVPPVGEDYTPFSDLSVSADGSTLHQLTAGYLHKRWLDPDSIRAALLNTQRQMVGFHPAQIRDLNLEKALLYPGNFERLANSGDLPLIRSFFDFYQEQASASNNINDVREYCTRAYTLYERLDPGVQRALQPTMIRMYTDFHWKLLLRNATEEAEALTALVNESFGNPRESQLAQAHTALLKSELTRAGSGYARWISKQYAEADEDYLFVAAMRRLENDFLQLVEYDLLRNDQLACACAALNGLVTPMPYMCTGQRDSLSRWLSAQDRNTHELLLQLYHFNTFGRAAENARFLENAYQALQTNSGYTSHELYNLVTRQLADVYIELGQLEQQMPPSELWYQRAIGILEQPTPNKRTERLRLEKRINTRSLIIERQLTAGNGGEALALLRQNGTDYQERLLSERDSFLIKQLQTDLGASLFEQYGRTYLLLNRPADAMAAFETAGELFPGGYKPMHAALAQLLAGNPAEAIRQLTGPEGIPDEPTYGLMAADIQQLSELLPEKKETLLGFQKRLAYLLTHPAQAGVPALDSLLLVFHTAEYNFQRAYTTERWGEALLYSQTMLKTADLKLSQSSVPENWMYNWVNAHINYAYASLFQKPLDEDRLSDIIRRSLDAEAFISRQLPDFPNAAYLKTNLAHAYWIRKKDRDRRKALDIYFDFLKDRNSFSTPAEAYEVLLKDFRDLHRAGVVIPELTDLVEALRPNDVILTEEEWRQMGLTPYR
ncbi:MAG: hypothetical protein SFV52_14545 [Saprospiraceae bacterium]|nr:hypothetical protein [Saprospiraceae bacterium]